MKLPLILLAAALLHSPVLAGSKQTLVDESFTAIPDTTFWKILGVTEVKGGKLILDASGDAGSFVSSGLVTVAPVEGLNFTESTVEIEMAGLNLGGSSAPEAQAFVLLIGSDNSSENASGSYLRLCLNGDGSLTLETASGEPGEGRSLLTVARSKVSLPIARLTLRLKADGYHLKFKDATEEKEMEGGWDGSLDAALWQSSAPSMVIKAVRRPGEGTCEASLNDLKITSQQP